LTDVQGSQNGRFVNLHNSLKFQDSQKKQKKNYENSKKKQNNLKITQNCCKSGSFLMIADPLWSCVMLLCGRLWSFAVFSHSLKTLKLEQPNVAQPLHNRLHACTPSSVFTNLHWGPAALGTP